MEYGWSCCNMYLHLQLKDMYKFAWSFHPSFSKCEIKCSGPFASLPCTLPRLARPQQAAPLRIRCTLWRCALAAALSQGIAHMSNIILCRNYYLPRTPPPTPTRKQPQNTIREISARAWEFSHARVMMINNDSWWSIMITGGYWWFMMIEDDEKWLTMIHDDNIITR